MDNSYKEHAINKIVENADFLRFVFDALVEASDSRLSAESRMSVMEDIMDRLEGEGGPNPRAEAMREIFRNLANLRTDGVLKI